MRKQDLEENKQLVREHYEELVNRKNYAAADYQLAADFVDHAAPIGTPRGPAAAKIAMQRLNAGIPDVRVTIEDLVAEGDRVATRATWRGTHQGSIFGISPTGRQVTITGMVLWRIAGGKIAERWATVDSSDLNVVAPLSLRGVFETALYSEDLVTAEEFYGNRLGLKKILSVPGRQLVLRCQNSILLVFNPTATGGQQIAINGAPIPLHGARGAGHAAFSIGEADVAAWRSRLGELRISIESEVDWPNGAHSIYFRDPAGNSLELATPDIWSESSH